MLDERPVETTLYSLTGTVPLPEQRQGERHVSLLRVASLVIEGRRELCLVRNVSAGGMMIRAYSDIAPETPVVIELKQGEPVSGTVRWANEDCLGVTFDQPIDIVELISASSEGPRPRVPRVEINCTAWVRDDGTVHRMKASNISQGGIRVLGSADLRIGTKVVVTLIDLPPAAGIVRWKDGESVGIHFVKPLSLPQLVAWLRAQQEGLRAAS